MRSKLLYTSEDGLFVLKGLLSLSISEPPVPVQLNEKAAGKFQGLELFENVSGSNSWPQTASDLVSNTYIRLTHQKPDATSAAFGTSIAGAPSFRTADRTFHFIPRVTGAVVDAGGPHRLRISVSGVYGDLAALSTTRTYSTDARINETKMEMNFSLTALQDIHLDHTGIGNDTFRLFSVSSMYADQLRHDGNVIKYKSSSQAKAVGLHTIEKRGRYIFSKAGKCSALELLNVPASLSSAPSPSIAARVIETSIPIKELAVQAYLAHTTNPDDDSLTIWMEWIRCPEVVQKGWTISAVTEFSAFPSEERRVRPKKIRNRHWWQG